MARVPEEEIERLKRETSLERLAEARGVKLRSTGKDLVGLCPFHDDREPSLVITPEKNLWHCLGACQGGGTAIDWVMRAEGVSFRHAVELLRGGAALSPAPREGPPPKQSRVRKMEALAPRDAGDAELLGRVADAYHTALLESPEALGYLKKRGLEQPEVAAALRLGYANRTLGYRLPPKHSKEGAELRGRLTELGIYRESGHEHLAGSLVVPLFDEHGAVVGMYGRKVQEHLREGTPRHLYLPGPHRGVFNRQGFGEGGEEMILCESLIDAMTFWCAGFRHVTSVYGTEGFTEEILEALVAAGITSVRIAFDRDEAGDRGADKVSEKLSLAGIDTYRVLFPRGMDANAYATKVAPVERSLEVALRNAPLMRRGSGRSTAGTTPLLEPAEGTKSSLPEIDESLGEAREAAAPSLAASPPSPAEPPAPSVPAPASPAARPLASEVTAVERGEDLCFRFGDRSWRVRELGKNTSLGALRVNVLVRRDDARGGFFVDTVELYAARQRAVFIRHAAEELELEESVLRRELGTILLELEKRRDASLAESLVPKKSPADAMSEEDRAEALALLTDPQLCGRLLRDLEACGVVGEETNKLVTYLAATSRKLEEPLAVVIQSSSAAGKSSLMDAVLALFPEEEKVSYSAMTGQSLFYMSGQDLRHKILAIAEEEGAERASYALKLLQSEGELTIASTGKDPATGRLVTQTYRVEGPVMILLTTTAIEVDEELMNRCLVLAVDEGREQTKAIHEKQRRAQTLEGLVDRQERRRIHRLYQNAQRLLRPLFVVNPFALELTFADHTTRTRRDHMKYLTLIRAVALLHQHQRPVRTMEHRGERIEYIEASREDVATATRLAHAVLGRTLDELPPGTRKLLHELDAMVGVRMDREGLARSEVRFTRREVREWTRWGSTQLKVHLRRLEELEYVLVHRTRGPSLVYELSYAGEGKEGEAFVVGLTYGADRSGSGEALSAPGRGEVGPLSGPYRRDRDDEDSIEEAANRALVANGAAKAHQGVDAKATSYA